MIEVIFSDGTQRFDSFRDAQKAVERKLRLSRSASYRKLTEKLDDKTDGTADLSAWRSPYVAYSIQMNDGHIITGTFLEIFAIARQHSLDLPKDRCYRRLTRSRVTPVPLSALTAPPAATWEIGAKGGAVIAEKTQTLFHGVEGHEAPVSATALYKEWKPLISKKCLYRRLVDGFRKKADLISCRLTRGVPQGRPRIHPLKPRKNPPHQSTEKAETVCLIAELESEPSVMDAETIRSILEEAERRAPPVTTKLPPMRDYRPAQTYIRGT